MSQSQTDQTQLEAELKKRAEEKQNLALRIQKALDTSDGKILLEHLSKLCHENESTYVDQNPNGAAYKEGQRSVILNLRIMLSKNINKNIQKEAKL